MLQNINIKLENPLYSYDSAEFMPIYRDGALDNQNELVAYKARQVGSIVGRIAAATAVGMVLAMDAAYHVIMD